MSTTPSRPTPPRPTPTPSPTEHEELARLLPTPPEREPSARHHQLLKAQLLREFRQDTAPAAAAKPRFGVRRLTMAAVPLAAGALAVTLATNGAFDGGERPGTDPRAATVPGQSSQSSQSGKATAATPAAVLLDRIATVAAARPATAVRDDQFVYVSSTVAWSIQNSDDPVLRLDTPHSRKIWLSVDGSQPGLLHERGKAIPLAGEVDKDGRPVNPVGNPHPTLNSPTYRYLESLPTDPDALLKRIYDETKGMGNGPDQQAFVTIGDLLREQLAPPKVSAALYKAAAKIPGVTVVEDSVDAAGRHGVAVARVYAGERTEWIFDKKSLEFLGERGVMVEDTTAGKKGQVTATTAVLGRGVTDEAGQAPGGPKDRAKGRTKA
ncbi:CU044_5270 family protein [Streptomyces sp. NPDC056144]|uniref:CU044_5270 family protein n=1 Tax=unclassified Streptomyces TaxID=2593676 RepID=UPI0035D6F579